MLEQKNLDISLLEVNKGQLYGLPKNPRFIKDDRYLALKKSIEEAPEMLSIREIVVYPLENGHYVVIGGNMRLRACQEIGYNELPCKILPLETPVAKLREYTIKDNIAFGSNDWDVIANDSNLPHVIVDGAANVLAGNPIKVVELINSLRLCQESTQTRSTRQKN